MKTTIRTAAALLAGLAASAAHAQTAVTIYGIADASVAYLSNVNAAGDHQVKMPSLTGTLPSRLGFRGSEDLGGGLSAVFNLETGFGMDTGSLGQGNRIFGRQAWVGLKNKNGVVGLGRQYTMTFYASLKSDVMGPNLFSLSSIDPYLANSRSDNSISAQGTFDGVTVGATYSLGRDTSNAGGPGGTNCAGEVAGNSKACRQASALIGYDTNTWGVTASYDILYGNVGAGGGLTSSNNSDRRVTSNLWAMLGATKLGMGVLDRRTAAVTGLVKSDLYFIGVSQPLAPQWVLDAQIAYRDIKNSSDDATMVVARVSYLLSKRTSVYLNLGHMNNKGNSAVALDAGGTVGIGKNQNGVDVGLRHFF
jgi:predicted porin